MIRRLPLPIGHRPLLLRAILCGAAFLLGAASSANACAQEIHFDTGTAQNNSHAQRVSVDTDAFTVEAGKPNWIEVRFHIAPGLHINSHEPKDETLIPTNFLADPASTLHLHHSEFPPGTPYRLNIGAGETLSTYQGSFNVRLELEPVGKGDATLTGRLHYQACDNASCFPPRDLPVQLAVHAR